MLLAVVAAGPLNPGTACAAAAAAAGAVGGPVVGAGTAAACPPAVSAATNAASTVTAAVDFATNPLGYILQQEKDSATSMAKALFPALESLTTPDLTQQWFIDAYERTFAVSILVWVLLLMWNFVLLARHRISGSTLVDSLAVYTPLFFVGSMFGPALAAFLMAAVHSIDASIIGWALTPTGTGPAPIGLASCVQAVAGNAGNGANTTASQFTAMLCAVQPQTMTGGVVLGIVLLALMIFALLLVLLVLIIMMVTLYLTGVVVPLGLVWVTNPIRRNRGMRIVSTWGGLLIAHPLLFFMVGVAFRVMAGVGQTRLGDGLKIVVNLLVAIIAIIIAVTSPVALLRFVPVGPAGGADLDGPSLGSLPSMPGGGLLARAADAGSSAGDQASSSGEAFSGAGGSSSSPGGGPSPGPAAGGGGGSGLGGMQTEAASGSSQPRPASPSSFSGAGSDGSAGAGPSSGGSSVSGGSSRAGSSGSGAGSAAARGGTPATASEAGAGAAASDGAGAAAAGGSAGGAAAGAAGGVALPVMAAAAVAQKAKDAGQQVGGLAVSYADASLDLGDEGS